jgi:hypothetical protein
LYIFCPIKILPRNILASCDGTSVTPAPGRLKQEDLKLEASLAYIMRPCLNTPRKIPPKSCVCLISIVSPLSQIHSNQAFLLVLIKVTRDLHADKSKEKS